MKVINVKLSSPVVTPVHGEGEAFLMIWHYPWRGCLPRNGCDFVVESEGESCCPPSFSVHFGKYNFGSPMSRSTLISTGLGNMEGKRLES
jgi:hypothetical protein